MRNFMIKVHFKDIDTTIMFHASESDIEELSLSNNTEILYISYITRRNK